MSKNVAKELYKTDFCKMVKFDCACGRRYINTSNCKQCTCGNENPTNADRIRMMTNEELAEFLIEVSTDRKCMTGERACKIETRTSCKDCFMEWLESEVKD